MKNKTAQNKGKRAHDEVKKAIGLLFTADRVENRKHCEFFPK